MIIENKGLKNDNFFIPSFELNGGEIVVLRLFGGYGYIPRKEYLRDIFTGNIKNESVTVHKPLLFVDYILESKWRRLFYPITVGEYLKKNANPSNEYATKIYKLRNWINTRTRIHNLDGASRKLLSLFAKLSKSKNIVFDLDGQDPLGVEEMYNFVKENVKNGGSAILLEWTNELRNDCTKFVELEWTD